MDTSMTHGNRNFTAKRLSKASSKAATQLLRTTRAKEAGILDRELVRGAHFQAWSKDTTGGDRRTKPFGTSVSSQMGVHQVDVVVLLQQIEQRLHLLKMQPLDFYHCCLDSDRSGEWTRTHRKQPSMKLQLMQAKRGYVHGISVTSAQFKNGLAKMNIKFGPLELRAVQERLINAQGQIGITAAFKLLRQLRGRLAERKQNPRGKRGQEMAQLTSDLAQGRGMERLFVTAGSAGSLQSNDRYQRKLEPGGPHILRMQERIRWGAGGNNGHQVGANNTYHSDGHCEENKRALAVSGEMDFTPHGGAARRGHELREAMRSKVTRPHSITMMKNAALLTVSMAESRADQMRRKYAY
jgi:hypothetical protein